ncbi:glycosyltransferase [Candidatus Viridilinea mediisalina]|uniref:Glycosyl transferase n=1 Tax=Candidatus Viridilinea mediisalina TaxID=2024553 RepID=A0A2A6RFD8_9CHLR|nr:glycosyltransferase [Candidatus Viridilinea mediisalina]PDW01797.1 glycosyl transferase [Candidatus Viridilinea mediisalina]
MISLICTVRDEADTIVALLDSMLGQTRLPDEIVINDCLSQDSTAALVRAYAQREPRVRLVAGGHNISSGRNHAIRAARGELIACTDAGLRLDPDWLAAIIAPLEAGRADLVGGFFRPAPQSLFELTLGAVNYRNLDEIDAATFLPFGKSMAFRRSLWETVGGFPETLTHCEDLVFALAAERAGLRRTFAPSALVHFRPRESLAAFARQYYFYGRGDAMAGLWPRRHLLRYSVYGALGGLLAGAWRWPRLRGPIAALIFSGAGAYTQAPYRRLWPRLTAYSYAERAYALALVPLIRFVGDVAKMVGYAVGKHRKADS